MPHLTRRRYPERPDCWHVYFGDVHVGTIAIRAGVPVDVDQWGWSCGFYPGSHPGECTERKCRHVRTGPRRLRSGMEGVPVQPNRGRLSGMAPSAGLYGREIRNVGARREVAVADTVVNDDVPTRGTIRQPRSRGQLRSPPAVMREIGTMKFVETTPP